MAFANSPRTTSRGIALAAAAALFLSACGASTPSTDAQTGDTTAPAAAEAADSSASDGSALASAISIQNDGTTAFEGHTPRGFMGSGVGLFAGDNLNSNFPNGEGIQILLHFALPEGQGVPSTATLSSDVMSTRGDVFEALGELRAAPVRYDAFSAALWNIEPTGDFVTCERPSDTSLTCDVTAAAAAAVEAGDSAVQIQLTLEQPSDSDGEQDLVLFNNGDSNLNEPGLFTLDLS